MILQIEQTGCRNKACPVSRFRWRGISRQNVRPRVRGYYYFNPSRCEQKRYFSELGRPLRAHRIVVFNG